MIITIIIGIIIIALCFIGKDTAEENRSSKDRQMRIDKYDPTTPYTVQFPNPETSSMDDIFDYINGETRLGALKAYRKIAVEKEVPMEIVEKIDSQIDRVISLIS